MELIWLRWRLNTLLWSDCGWSEWKNRGFPDWGWQNYPLFRTTPIVRNFVAAVLLGDGYFAWGLPFFRVQASKYFFFFVTGWIMQNAKHLKLFDCFCQRIFCLTSCQQCRLEPRGPPMTSPIGFVRIKGNKTWLKRQYALQLGVAHVCLCNRCNHNVLTCATTDKIHYCTWCMRGIAA